ncbi:MAG: dienelactone hydrolase family protein [Deltaproteobacteria bacterium]|nr:dienelactone hydrolase family protein [Deltaproteobacteria bacterium]
MYESMIAENINIRVHNNDLIETYLARPLGEGLFPGVVLIHHYPGWDEASKEMIRKFAHHKYIGIMPNLHHREGPGTGPEVVGRVREAGGVPDDRCIGDIDGAIRYLETMPGYNGKVGIIGFCSGGRQVYLTACNIERIDAAVDCYGGGVVVAPENLTERQPVAPIDMTENLACPLLGLFGAEDKNPSPEHVKRREEELQKHNKAFEFHTYEDAGHAFFSVDRPSYRQHAAVDAWEKVFAWYEKYLS